MKRLTNRHDKRGAVVAISVSLVLGLVGGVASASQLAAGQVGDPPLPRSISARVSGNVVTVKYCFTKPMPTRRSRRPFQVNVGVDNFRDNLPPLVLPWPVTKACGVVRQPTGAVKRPFSVTMSVTSRSGNRSRVLRIRPKFA